MSRSVPLCPHCAEPSDQPLLCERCSWRWYSNPKPAAAVLLERISAGGGAAVLLLRRAVDPGAGGWDLPAGYLDPGESFEDAARREALEEAGLEVDLVALAGAYHSPAANAVTVVYRARAVDLTADVTVDHESSDHAWVPRAAAAEWLPRMAFPSMAAALADWASGQVGGPAPREGDRSLG